MAWTMRLPEDEEKALTEQAAREGRSKHELVRDATREYVMRHRTWDEPMDFPDLDLTPDLSTRVHEVLRGDDREDDAA
ncbi:CopG family transcriptional regulator [Streptomyces sp. KLOTTS4A1]|uniref:ribbon-helix-helix domain-containing protein n=1 Tax=Streptomyces sp. KLOTTS4A1 TaxID=3390996 RepID=UPI0039F49BF7